MAQPGNQAQDVSATTDNLEEGELQANVSDVGIHAQNGQLETMVDIERTESNAAKVITSPESSGPSHMTDASTLLDNVAPNTLHSSVGESPLQVRKKAKQKSKWESEEDSDENATKKRDGRKASSRKKGKEEATKKVEGAADLLHRKRGVPASDEETPEVDQPSLKRQRPEAAEAASQDDADKTPQYQPSPSHSSNDRTSVGPISVNDASDGTQAPMEAEFIPPIAPPRRTRLIGPPLVSCRNVDNYEKLNRIEEGAYGVVYRARDRQTGEIVALKKLKLENENNGFPVTSLREIHTLLLAKHPNIVNVKEIVVTPSMRGAPELLLGAKEYTTAIDIWSVGCIFGELVNKEPLLPGRGEIDQLKKMFQLLGTPTERTWPGMADLPGCKTFSFANQPYNNLRSRFPYLTENGLNLMTRLLTYDPEKRITAEEALRHPYFTENPLPKDPSLFPTFPSKGAGEKRKVYDSPSAPKAAHGGETLAGDGDEGGGLFDALQAEPVAAFRLKV
ncbi:uncharacterized protein SPPG_08910 [Spizellomyces punctatus DAOM BR117]|uniref:cyclin-dependent kinase n=1 Tax=Spizellomyces punctatus (strain DAOM BR117) TaxID=645134 RepID=A0A0L0HRG8_SPIPD|nr:uncharacterized protein SPPG_08910 [Spizellomyces punctatus DAOM BR117]KND03667.1 hypothetical protein SPPG_08910 [Spizellomyces punctatus DAOM BR117]|eukprot:XP_016611706.1 hypothetical protein SPPG_08910 [Spizellomyces punctatus DAOM BR117]